MFQWKKQSRATWGASSLYFHTAVHTQDIYFTECSNEIFSQGYVEATYYISDISAILRKVGMVVYTPDNAADSPDRKRKKVRIMSINRFGKDIYQPKRQTFTKLREALPGGGVPYR